MHFDGAEEQISAQMNFQCTYEVIIIESQTSAY